jgi:hypothetical protein
VTGLADLLDEVGSIVEIIIDFSKAIALVPHDGLLVKLTASGVDPNVIV